MSTVIHTIRKPIMVMSRVIMGMSRVSTVIHTTPKTPMSGTSIIPAMTITGIITRIENTIITLMEAGTTAMLIRTRRLGRDG
ncbi:MAG: hypothetical protein OXF41_20235 [bacterium]|nr:hypothetical protein [bacterium]